MKCKDCNYELKSKRTLGWGNQKSKLMIISDSPNRDDIKFNEPFCGTHGKELMKILNEFNIKKSDLYFTNALCFIPFDEQGRIRKIEKQDIAQCRTRLLNEIQEVNPDIILCFGKTATYAVTGIEENLASIRGNILKSLDVFNERPVIATWHPSYLSSGNMGRKAFPQFISDIQKALVESKIVVVNNEEINYKILLDFSEIIAYIKEIHQSKKFFAFDFETTGGKIDSTIIIGVSFCYKNDEAVYVALRYRDEMGKIQLYHSEKENKIIEQTIIDILASNDNPKTAFFKKYEITVAKSFWNCEIKRIVIDAYLTYYLRNEEEKHPSLEFMEELYFPSIPRLKSEIKNLKLSDYSLIPLLKLGRYGAEDSLFTYRIAIIERKKLEQIVGYNVC